MQGPAAGYPFIWSGAVGIGPVDEASLGIQRGWGLGCVLSSIQFWILFGKPGSVVEKVHGLSRESQS